jgi:hypothetical protein
MFHYAWFNYVTHRPLGDGAIIVNRNEHAYKLVNAIAFGLYFHRNHHIRPSLFDPRSFVAKDTSGPHVSLSIDRQVRQDLRITTHREQLCDEEMGAKA